MRLFRSSSSSAPLLLSLGLPLWVDVATADPSPMSTAIQHKDPVPGEKYNYGQAMYLSFLFYEAQRSGKMPANNRIPWRNDALLTDHADHNGQRLDLSGGWYDAGDHVKYTFTMAYSVAVLAWGIGDYEYAWTQTGELDNALDGIKWPLDYFIKCHPDNDTYFVQLGDFGNDHGYWGAPEYMSQDKVDARYATAATRPNSRRREQWWGWGGNNNNNGGGSNNNGGGGGGVSAGVEPTAESAAAMAASALAFKGTDDIYARELLSHAVSLMDLALDLANHNAPQYDANPYYDSSGYTDELCWAAAWLYRATGEVSYLDIATKYYGSGTGEFSWDSKGPGAQLLLYELTGDQRYASDFMSFMDGWMSQQTTQQGLTFRSQWASLRYAANGAFLALRAADLGLKPNVYRPYGAKQINYALGDARRNGAPYTYLIGFGGNPSPRNPHHRGASCGGTHTCSCGSSGEPVILYGALVGGPKDTNDNYNDECPDYTGNEVTMDYNAAFTSAVAALRNNSLTVLLESGDAAVAPQRLTATNNNIHLRGGNNLRHHSKNRADRRNTRST